MRTKSDHRVQFRWADNTNIELMDIINPSYVYKVGDKIDISYYAFVGPEKKIELHNVKVVVTDVTHEVIESIVYEQIETIHIQKA
jgi:hypothetical protein